MVDEPDADDETYEGENKEYRDDIIPRGSGLHRAHLFLLYEFICHCNLNS